MLAKILKSPSLKATKAFGRETVQTREQEEFDN